VRGLALATAHNQRPFDFLDDPVDVLENVVVPEAKDQIAGRTKRVGSQPIRLNCLGMLAAVNFDDQLRLDRRKISYEGADRYLATKFDPLNLPVAQSRPQSPLCVGSSAAQAARKLDGLHPLTLCA
jgi:hypothetical protein